MILGAKRWWLKRELLAAFLTPVGMAYMTIDTHHPYLGTPQHQAVLRSIAVVRGVQPITVHLYFPHP